MRTSRRAAFTVIELTLAMGITALVGLSVAAATMVISAAREDVEQYQEYVQSARSTSLRVQSALRKASLITSCTPTTLVYWMGDANGNGQINASELVRLSYDHVKKEVREWQVDLGNLNAVTAAILDATVSLATAMDDAAVRELMTATYRPYLQDRLLSSSVRSVEFSTDKGAPLTGLVHVRLDVGDQAQAIVVQSAVSLRSSATPRVGIVDSVYVLVGTN